MRSHNLQFFIVKFIFKGIITVAIVVHCFVLLPVKTVTAAQP